MVDRFRNELWTIVTSDALGNAIHRKRLRQTIDYILTGHAPSDVQRDTTPGVFINDRKPIQ